MVEDEKYSLENIESKVMNEYRDTDDYCKTMEKNIKNRIDEKDINKNKPVYYNIQNFINKASHYTDENLKKRKEQFCYLEQSTTRKLDKNIQNRSCHNPFAKYYQIHIENQLSNKEKNKLLHEEDRKVNYTNDKMERMEKELKTISSAEKHQNTHPQNYKYGSSFIFESKKNENNDTTYKNLHNSSSPRMIDNVKPFQKFYYQKEKSFYKSYHHNSQENDEDRRGKNEIQNQNFDVPDIKTSNERISISQSNKIKLIKHKNLIQIRSNYEMRSIHDLYREFKEYILFTECDNNHDKFFQRYQNVADFISQLDDLNTRKKKITKHSLTTEEKRNLHSKCELKRRTAINAGLKCVADLVDADQNIRKNKKKIIFKAVKRILVNELMQKNVNFYGTKNESE